MDQMIFLFKFEAFYVIGKSGFRGDSKSFILLDYYNISEKRGVLIMTETSSGELPYPEGYGFPLHGQNLHYGYVM
jgi:hypothetical protein